MTGPHYRRAPQAVWRATGSFVVAAVPPNEPTTIGGSAPLVWAALAAPQSIDQLAAELAAATGASPADVRRDLTDLIAALVPLGLVEVVA